jgi:EpsI family protein
MRTRSFCLAAVFVASWAGLMAAMKPPTPVPRAPLLGLPMEFGGWQGRPGAPLDRRTQEILGADDYVSRIYTDNAGAVVSLYVGYHGTQRHGDSIHSPMNCLPGAGWIPVQSDRVSIDVGSRAIVVNRIIIQKGEERQLVLYWYQGRGRFIADEYVSKAYQFVDALRTGRTDAALVRIISPVDRELGPSSAERTATGFMADLLPLLPRHLPD